MYLVVANIIDTKCELVSFLLPPRRRSSGPGAIAMLLHGAFVMLSLLSLSLCAEDFYRLLQLERTASERDIKKAYRTLSKRYHPDKNA